MQPSVFCVDSIYLRRQGAQSCSVITVLDPRPVSQFGPISGLPKAGLLELVVLALPASPCRPSDFAPGAENPAQREPSSALSDYASLLDRCASAAALGPLARSG